MKLIALFFYMGLCLLFWQCKEDLKDIENPFDQNNNHNNTNNESAPYSLSSIHDEILFPKCATPGCHDGSFEPNFSSLMSSYTTLVYHPIIKNNASESFKYRVIPFDSKQSVLYERITNCCFVNENDRMPQDNIGVGLPSTDIERIKKWIDTGAKDFLGNSAKAPNNQPVFQWYWMMVDEGFPLNWEGKRLHEEANRVDQLAYQSIILDTNLMVLHFPSVSDDQTALKDLKNGRLVFALDKNDFSDPILTVQSLFLAAGDGFWYNRFNTQSLPVNRIIYMRYYINDGEHEFDTENPDEYSEEWFKSYWSVIVIPGSLNNL